MDTRTRDLTFTMKKSIRYHDYRRGFYRAAVSWIHFLGIVMGSAAIATLTEETVWKVIFPAVFTVVSAVGLVVRVGEKQALHTDLYKRWVRLEQKYLKDEMTVDQLEIESLEIELDEPPLYKALNRHCHNEVLFQEDQADKMRPLDRRHKLFKSLWRFHELPTTSSSGSDQEASEYPASAA